MKREDIAQILSLGIAKVTFTKVDGTERIMNCTIAPNLIPADKMPIVEELSEDKPVRKVNLSVMRVFDTDIQEWRSFKVANVISVEVGPDEHFISPVLFG